VINAGVPTGLVQVPPGDFVPPAVLEKGGGHREVVVAAKLEHPQTVLRGAAFPIKAVASDGALPVGIITAYLGIEIPQDKDHIAGGNGRNQFCKLFIEGNFGSLMWISFSGGIGNYHPEMETLFQQQLGP
jgi:hypothetical protein